MKKVSLVAAVLVLCVVWFIPKPQAASQLFTVEFKDGEKLWLENFYLEPTTIDNPEPRQEFTLYHELGTATFPRNLQGVQHIDVLDDGKELKVTFDNGEVISGKVMPLFPIKSAEVALVFAQPSSVGGIHGRNNFSIPFSIIASISRGWEEDSSEQ